MIKMYTDGACKGNPGAGGWGAVICPIGDMVEIGGYVPDTTNNRMELTAAIEALKYIHRFSMQEIEIISDSRYLIEGMNSWINKWRDNKWRTSTGEPVKNKDLWLDLHILKNLVTWKWMKRGAYFFNLRADEIAKAFSRGERPTLREGVRE